MIPPGLSAGIARGTWRTLRGNLFKLYEDVARIYEDNILAGKASDDGQSQRFNIELAQVREVRCKQRDMVRAGNSHSLWAQRVYSGIVREGANAGRQTRARDICAAEPPRMLAVNGLCRRMPPAWPDGWREARGILSKDL